MSEKVKRLLVLTSATGAGHDTHARATTDWCDRLFGPKVEVTIAHALEDSHPVYRQGVAFYNFIQREMPWFHHLYYNGIELLELFNPGTVGFGRKHCVELFERMAPHAILSVHDCLNRGYFELAREVLGTQVRCATYCPEFEGGYGFSRNWVNPRGDYFFGRTSETVEEAVRRGAPPGRAMVVGHWAPPSFYQAPTDASFLREACGLDPDRFTLLLSTGGAGAQNHRSVLQALRPLADRIQVVALCGQNAAARTALEGWAARESPLPIRFLGFTDRMPQLLQSCTAVVVRAGATTAGEALLCGCPVIFNGIGGTMPQELPTWRYFQAREIGSMAHRPAEICHQVKRWLDDPAEHSASRHRMAATRDATTPEVFLEKLLELPAE